MSAAGPRLSVDENRLASAGMRRLRQEQGLTQAAVAARMGTGRGKVGLYERGAARLGLGSAGTAAAALGTDYEGLLAAGAPVGDQRDGIRK